MRRTICGALTVGLLAAASLGGPAGAQQLPVAKCKGKTATIVGTAGRDRIEAGNGRDVIAARDGNDVINAGGGNDLICAGRGGDTVRGGKGSDRIFTRGGSDFARGGASSDRLDTGADGDLLIGGGGPGDLCLGGRPSRELGLRGDYADTRSCETIRSARRVTFAFPEEAETLANRLR